MPSMEEVTRMGREMEEARKQKELQELRSTVMDILEFRFEADTATISDQLADQLRLLTLSSLVRKAAMAETLAEFEQYLASLD